MKPSPCHSCKNKDKCNYVCVPWGKWFAEQWNIVVAPFREIKKGAADEKK